MKIKVQCGAIALEISVPDDSRVADMQKALEDATGVHSRNQKLVFKGKVLSAGDPLSAYRGLKDGSKVMLIAAAGDVGETSGAAEVRRQREERAQQARERAQQAIASKASTSSAPHAPTWDERAKTWASRGPAVEGIRLLQDAGCAALLNERYLADVHSSPFAICSGVISLSGMGMERLPDQATSSALASARLLDASVNALTSLPSSIASLKSLTRINLTRNQLKGAGVPWHSLAQLPCLHVLDLSCNLISELPSELSAATGLLKLNMRGNELESVPGNSLGGLLKLQVLDLSDNKLTSLPEELCRLGSLEELRIDNNRISDLPANTASLEQLQVLSANNNRISKLPAGMLSGCKCLHLLRIHDNKVTLEQLRDEPGYEAYDARRRARYSKVIEGSAMFDGFDEGASSTLFDHFAS